MSDHADRCALCGRLAARLEAGYCGARCRDLAASGYANAAHDPAALAAPTTTCEGKLLVSGALPDALPDGCAVVGRTLQGADVRHLVRVGAATWGDLDATVDEVRARCEEDAVEVFTLQQFAAGGLAAPLLSPTRKAKP